MGLLSQIRKNAASWGRYSPDVCHERALEDSYPIFSYEKNGKDPAFREIIEQKFLSCLGDMPEPFDPVCVEESKVDKGSYTQIRMIIETEKDCKCPCLLLLPKGVSVPPVVICLQGHSNGMMISVGERYMLKDAKKIEEDRDFGLQAVKNGYAAMIVEQRGFGERRSKVHLRGGANCNHLAHNAILVGRTLIGERLWDIRQVISVLEKRTDVDSGRLGIMGNSGGGTASYYAACFDKRIKVVMPSCALCTYRDSIGDMYHCACNYLPGAGKYFDMGELSCLIYPRPIVVVSGLKDPIFPIKGARKVVDVMKKIYGKESGNVVHYIGEGKHRFYAGAWKEFNKFMEEQR